VTSIEERFTADEVPFLLRGSRVASFGVATDLALLDHAATPTRGVATRLSAEQFKAADTSDLDYRRFHTEARAYVPVFAPRRVLAMRLLHDWVDTAPGSPDVPYYRLPETNDNLLFPGYRSHRFTDNHLVLGQLEYRWQLMGRVDALLSANAGEVASTASRLRFDQKHEAYGVGFRYGYSDRWCARLDIAKGSEPTQFFLTLEGAF
jgi:outer membrane protein assembly factor BamA